MSEGNRKRNQLPTLLSVCASVVLLLSMLCLGSLVALRNSDIDQYDRLLDGLPRPVAQYIESVVAAVVDFWSGLVGHEDYPYDEKQSKIDLEKEEDSVLGNIDIDQEHADRIQAQANRILNRSEEQFEVIANPEPSTTCTDSPAATSASTSDSHQN